MSNILDIAVVSNIFDTMSSKHVIAETPEAGSTFKDRQVAIVGARNAYYVLLIGVWGALTAAALSLGAFWFAHAALLAIVLAEITRCASQLVYYRRGVPARDLT